MLWKGIWRERRGIPVFDFSATHPLISGTPPQAVTGPRFIPILRRQQDYATEHAQEDRIVLFDRLIKDIDGEL
jgi:hypothetical protein